MKTDRSASARRRVAVLCLLHCLLPCSLTAYPHPLGNMGISHYSALRVEADRIEVRHVLDFAEIPTFQESQLHRFTTRNDDPSLDGYLHKLSQQVLNGLVLKVDGAQRTLRVQEPCTVRFSEGAAGMRTMRIVCDLRADARIGTARSEVQLIDTNYQKRSGWKEMIIRAGTGVALLSQSVPNQDRSNELTHYPDGMLSTPLQITESRAVVQLAQGHAR